MAIIVKTITNFPLNGSTREFDITFDYLARRFIKVSIVDGDTLQELAVGTDYRFVTKTKIRTTIPLGAPWERIEIRRETSSTDRIVNFSDGSILRAKDLNASQIQAIHIAEEARDIASLSIAEDMAGQLDAKGRRVKNVGEPLEDSDAATKGYVDSGLVTTLRFGREVPALTGDVSGRILSFDSNNNPIAVIAGVTSEIALATLLKSINGASEVGASDGKTVQEHLTSLNEFKDTLLSEEGASNIKTSSGDTVQEVLDELLSFNPLKSVGNVEGWRDEYPDDTDCINAALSSGRKFIYTDPDRLYNIRSGVIYTRKNQKFTFSGLGLKRVDSEVNRKNLLEMDDYSAIQGKIDGNYLNNIYDEGSWTSLESVPFAQNVYMGRSATSVGATKLAVGCTVVELETVDSIRSGIVICGDGHTIGPIVSTNSYTDHWVYFSSVSNTKVSKVTGSGLCRAEGFSFGTDITSKAINVTVDEIVIKGITYKNLGWYTLPPRYLALRWNSHEGVNIGNIDIEDLSTPAIDDSLQVHRRVAIYESVSPARIGGIRIKTIVKPQRSLITVELNSATIGSIDCEYVADGYAAGDGSSSILRTLGGASIPVLVSVGNINIRGDGKGSRIAIAASSTIHVNSMNGLAGATSFGNALYATSSLRAAKISLGSWEGGATLFTRLTETLAQSGFNAQVNLLSNMIVSLGISGNQAIDYPGSNVITLRGVTGGMVNRLRYFNAGDTVTLLGDGITVLQQTSFMVNLGGTNITTVVGQPYRYIIGSTGVAYQI